MPYTGRIDTTKGSQMTEQIELPEAAANFKAWRDGMSLSLTEAGKALGVSRRTITNYQNGSTPVPDSVKKLCALLKRDKQLGI